MPQRRFVVRGRVQGVGFRWWTRSLARRLSLSGTVRNHEDGAVVIDASGAEAALSSLRDSLQVGPPGSQVTSVEEVALGEAVGPSFEIVE